MEQRKSVALISYRVTDRASTANNLSNFLDKLNFDIALRTEFVKDLDEYKRTSESPSINGFIDEVSAYREQEYVKDKFNQT